MTVDNIQVDPNVATRDQQHASALEELRAADRFVLMVPHEDQVLIVANGNAIFFLTALTTLADACEEAMDAAVMDHLENGGTE